jgi:hypothetical protein
MVKVVLIRERKLQLFWTMSLVKAVLVVSQYRGRNGMVRTNLGENHDGGNRA